jgi:competence protein ComEA
VELNSATAEPLQRVPGIGPKTAQAIVNFQKKSGPFRRVQDLLAVKGISKRKVEGLRPYATVLPPASKPQ